MRPDAPRPESRGRPRQRVAPAFFVLALVLAMPTRAQPPDDTEADALPAAVYLSKITWSGGRGVTRIRLVEGKCRSEGEPGAVLLDPTFPARPLLGMHCRFNPSGTRAPSSVHDLRRRWASATLPGTVGAWVIWGVLSLMTGESMSPHLRTACMLVVAIMLTFIGGRSDGDSPRQSRENGDKSNC